MQTKSESPNISNKERYQTTVVFINTCWILIITIKTHITFSKMNRVRFLYDSLVFPRRGRRQ